MPANTPVINSFNAGEFSPLMMGQSDFQKWKSGAKKILNFIPRSQGPLERRGGTYFIGETRSSAARSWLGRFEFNTTQAFILEFSPGFIRFYRNYSVALDGSSNVLQIASPYTAEDLTNDDGGFGLSMVQSGDVIYICCHNGTKRPYKLSRNSNTDWVLAPLDTAAALGPFDNTNADRTRTVYTDQFRIWSADGADRPDGTPTTTSLCTITSNTPIFESGHVGSLFYIEASTDKTYGPQTGNNNPDTTWGSVEAWQAAHKYFVLQYVRSDGKYYEAISAGGSSSTGASDDSGSTQPTWTAGAHNDGGLGITWRYANGGWGVVLITAVNSSTEAVGKIVQELPPSVRGSDAKTYKYAFGDWSESQGYPEKVAFYKGRLCFAGRHKLWFSVASDYENFTPMSDGFEVQADDSINVQIEADSTNTIQWLASGSTLLIGTAGNEFSCSPSTTTNAFGPDNIQITQESRYGSKGVNAILVGNTVLFIQRAGCKVRAVQADYQSGQYSSTDLTVLAEHITRVGIVDFAWQQEPDYVVWVVLTNGELVGMTYNAEQEITGWHRHDLTGKVEAVNVIPSPDGKRDDVWLVVNRTINGATKRYIEYIKPGWDAATQPISQAFYVDCGLSYSGAPVTSVSGLGHLEGQTISVVTDGAVHPDQVVTGGAISLQWESSVIHAGLPFSSELITLPLEIQSKTKRVNKGTVRFVNSLGGKVGTENSQHMDTIASRDYNDLMDQIPGAYTEDKTQEWPGGYEGALCLRILQDQPLPMTICAVYPDVWTNA